MYSKEGTIRDRREMLKVKIKSLAAEATIIKREEQRLLDQANPARPAYRNAYKAEMDKTFEQMATIPGAINDDVFNIMLTEGEKAAAKAARIAAKLARSKMRRPASINPLFDELHQHRIHVVRREARAAHIAYMLIKGWCYADIEPTRGEHNFPDWSAIVRLCQKYGPSEHELVDHQRLMPKAHKGAIAEPANH